VTRNVTVFAVAALLEIAGCFAFWAWLRRGVTPLVLVLGIASLIGFALVLTRVDSAFAGRAYVPRIVPASAQNTASRANSSQVGRSWK
jgi:drug/metabolite transporter superfamily protein YnfA